MSTGFFQIRISYLCCKQDSDRDQDSYLLDQDWSRLEKTWVRTPLPHSNRFTLVNLTNKPVWNTKT